MKILAVKLVALLRSEVFRADPLELRGHELGHVVVKGSSAVVAGGASDSGEVVEGPALLLARSTSGMISRAMGLSCRAKKSSNWCLAGAPISSVSKDPAQM